MARTSTAQQTQTEQSPARHCEEAFGPTRQSSKKTGSPRSLTVARDDGRVERRQSGWSPERRARQAARIRLWAPWAKSTGPKTAAGKARSSRNALKTARPDRIVKAAMRAYGRYLVDLECYIGLRKRTAQNELLKRPLYNLKRRLLKRGQKLTARLNAALLYAKLEGKRRFPPALPDACRVGIVL